jgi:hypothetical protein
MSTLVPFGRLHPVVGVFVAFLYMLTRPWTAKHDPDSRDMERELR